MTTTGTTLVDVVVASCDCGLFPLENAVHLDAFAAWEAAARHVALNPGLCHPSLNRSQAPASLMAR